MATEAQSYTVESDRRRPYPQRASEERGDRDGNLLLLKDVCPTDIAAQVVNLIRSTPGVGRISSTASIVPGMDVIEREIPGVAADRLLADLAALDGWGDGDVTMTEVGDTDRIRFSQGAPVMVAAPDDVLAVRQVRAMLRHLVRFDYQCAWLMMMAALIAAVGLITDLPIAVVGAMAFSPQSWKPQRDGVLALLIRDGRFFWHGPCRLLRG